MEIDERTILIMQNLNFKSSSSKPPKLTKSGAETLAIEALNYLAAEPARLDRFLALSGIGLENLRAAAAEPGFLAAILDHLASDEKLLLAFAADTGQDASLVVQAHTLLSPPVEMP
jgi:hypothetical protein